MKYFLPNFSHLEMRIPLISYTFLIYMSLCAIKTISVAPDLSYQLSSKALSVWEWLFTCTLPNNDRKISFDDFKFQHFPFVCTYICSYVHISYFSCPISLCWWDYRTNQTFVFKGKRPKKLHFHTLCNQSTFFFIRQLWDSLSILIFCHLGSTWCNL